MTCTVIKDQFNAMVLDQVFSILVKGELLIAAQLSVSRNNNIGFKTERRRRGQKKDGKINNIHYTVKYLHCSINKGNQPGII